MDPEGMIVRGIRKRFGAAEVLTGVNLHAPPGQVTALVGQNGAGKSTLFRILMGLLREDAGGAEIDGRDILGLPLHEKSGVGLGYLPQECGSFLDLTVRQNLTAVLEILPIPRAERGKRLGELLELTGLENVPDRPFRVLSGGEQRRLEIAKALAARPRVLLLDEPFSGLDPRIVGELACIVSELAERGVAILLTDHNVHQMLRFVGKVYFLAGGVIACEGTPAEVIRDSTAKEMYFGEDFHLG